MFYDDPRLHEGLAFRYLLRIYCDICGYSLFAYSVLLLVAYAL